MLKISGTTHCLIDYTVNPLLMALPWFFAKKSEERAAALVPAAFGAVAIGYTLCTDQKYSVWKKVPIQKHLKWDAVGSLALLAMPFFLHKTRSKLIPLSIATMELAVVALTQTGRSEQAPTAAGEAAQFVKRTASRLTQRKGH